jgi:hypothetical protein
MLLLKLAGEVYELQGWEPPARETPATEAPARETPARKPESVAAGKRRARGAASAASR